MYKVYYIKVFQLHSLAPEFFKGEVFYFSAGSDNRWYCDKLENSQSDLSSSKWLCSAESTIKSDFCSKSQSSHPLNSSDSDIFPLRSGISYISNESSYSRGPNPLLKSSSSSQIPYLRTNFNQTNRQWKFNSMGKTSTMQMSAMPYVPSPFSNINPNHGRPSCPCAGTCGKKTVPVHSFLICCGF